MKKFQQYKGQGMNLKMKKSLTRPYSIAGNQSLGFNIELCHSQVHRLHLQLQMLKISKTVL